MFFAGEILGAVLHLLRLFKSHFAVVIFLVFAFWYFKLLIETNRRDRR